MLLQRSAITIGDGDDQTIRPPSSDSGNGETNLSEIIPRTSATSVSSY